MAVAWPTGADTKAWMRAESIGDDADELTVLDELTEAATDVIFASLDPAYLPDGAPVGDTCPIAVKRAIMMRAAALYIRRDSPSGVVAVSADSVFRVNRFDSDVDNLLAPYVPIPVL